jgi:hypothetical protein
MLLHASILFEAQHHCICKYSLGRTDFLVVYIVVAPLFGSYYSSLSLCRMNPQQCVAYVSLLYFKCDILAPHIQETLTLAWLLISLLATVSTG